MKAATVTLLLAALATAGCGASIDREAPELVQSAKLALQQGQLPEAEALIARGAALTSGQPDSAWARTFALLRAEVLINQNKLADAAPFLAAALPTGSSFDVLRAMQLYLHARVHVAEGRFAEARDALQHAAALAPTPGAQRFQIDTLAGQVHMRLGDWATGESVLNAVVTASAGGDNAYLQALALNNLGMGNVVRSQFDRALPQFERILAMTGLKDLVLYAHALHNAGICYARLGQFERALAVQQEAIDLYRRRGSSTDQERSRGQLGTTHLQLGNTAEGLKYLREAFEIANTSNLTDDAALWAGNMASAYTDLGDWAQAQRYNDEARRIREQKKSARLVYNTLNDAHIAVGLGRADEAERLFRAALDASGDAPNIVWEAQAGLAQSALAGKRPERAARYFEAALGTIEKTRAGLLKSDYKVSFLSRLIQFYQAYVDRLIEQGQTARALEIADSSRARVLAERHGVTSPARASSATFRRLAADSRTQLVSYWLGPTRSYAWAVTGSGIKFATLPAAKTIEELVTAHQAMIANSLADPLAGTDTPGDRLYRMLVEPLLPSAPPGTSIVIVPDGALHGLNFETLPVNGARRHYWIEDVEIQVAPSLTTLTVAPAAADAQDVRSSLLVMGNPTPHPPEFPSLGYASAEMTAVAARFSGDRVTRIELDRASPGAYRDARPDQFTFVHFAAHATTNLESPLDSAVILSGPDDAYKLYARDVAAQPLRAELVTVSACRSAGERAYSGEGLVGFAWAFLRAGARRVIAGLWDVDDRSTADLMGRLYEHLAAGAEPADALRRAKLAVIQEGGPRAKPYYWAPLELFTLVLSPPSRPRLPEAPVRPAAARATS